VYDSATASFDQPGVEPWLRRFAERAMQGGGTRAISHHDDAERILRASAEPFRTADGRSYVVIAVADEIELEDKYAALIATSVTAALLSLVLVAIGGWFVAGRFIAPVAHMQRFMADAAHELRTPLAVVRSRAEVALQRPRDPAEYEDALRGIERESARVGRIVEDLLTLARADAGERSIERQRLFLDDIALDAANAARALAEPRNVRIDVGRFEEGALVGDGRLIRQLVVILLDNAIKFSRPGGRVTIDVQRVAGDAVLTVADEGIGIPPDQLPHVLERFYRGRVATPEARRAWASGSPSLSGSPRSMARRFVSSRVNMKARERQSVFRRMRLRRDVIVLKADVS
jgi:signal transduction histidine kinase